MTEAHAPLEEALGRILGSDGRVLGTFANDSRVVRDPGPSDRELTSRVTGVAARAIERAREARDGPPGGRQASPNAGQKSASR